MITQFSQIIGNNLIKEYLLRIVDKKVIGQSWLFAGPDGIGKGLFAQAFASLIITQEDPQGRHAHKIKSGQHPDIHLYKPEGKLGFHSIQSLRQLNEEVYLPPYEAAWKVFIIYDADRMLTYSANALLKTFEEPPSHTVIILISSEPASLLPTILSRCRTVHFQALTDSEIQSFLQDRYELPEKEASQIASLAQGSLARALDIRRQNANSNRDVLLKVLAQGGFNSYKQLTHCVQTLANQIESSKKQVEEAAKEERSRIPIESLSAQHQHALEKELEGKLAMGLFQESNTLFEQILSWYRDLHLLQLNGSDYYVINKDYQAQLIHALQRGGLPSIESVQKMIKEARMALQRSTSLSICLENLLLKLNLVDPFPVNLES